MDLKAPAWKNRFDLGAFQVRANLREGLEMKVELKPNAVEAAPPFGGLAGVLLRPLLKRLSGARRTQPRLELVERISIAPRQSLSLVEAEGRRFLVATSVDGAPAFYPLDGGALPAPRRAPRVSW